MLSILCTVAQCFCSNMSHAFRNCHILKVTSIKSNVSYPRDTVRDFHRVQVPIPIKRRLTDRRNAVFDHHTRNICPPLFIRSVNPVSIIIPSIVIHGTSTAYGQFAFPIQLPVHACTALAGCNDLIIISLHGRRRVLYMMRVRLISRMALSFYFADLGGRFAWVLLFLQRQRRSTQCAHHHGEGHA